ncbi:MAG: sugar kinase [Saccharospirillum sp.]|nr:sugar kinase [Saccharospirillum sp.]
MNAGVSLDLVCLGECMLELRALEEPGLVQMGYGGDSYNTAYYARKLGIKAGYVTVLGRDALSQRLVDSFQADGVDTEGVFRDGLNPPGMYWIENDEAGDRRFHYWRSQSPVRTLFHRPLMDVLDVCQRGRVFYLSLISVAVVENRDALVELLSALSDRCVIVYDSNYRPALWRNREEALYWHSRILPFAEHYMPSLDDECALYDCSETAALSRLERQSDHCTLILKRGERGALICKDKHWRPVAGRPVQATDATGAGDSFNGAYLAGICSGLRAWQAAEQSSQLAAEVVRYPGALLPANHPFFSVERISQ